MKKLIAIQHELKAPKSNFNNFGKYKYRNCEDILEAVKPLLAKEECTLTITDDVVLIGDRFYIKATATITDGTETVSVTAFARESAEKKGMDDSQVTGTASSYARKYALNGLFLIDDTKDADTDEYVAADVDPNLATKKEKENFLKRCEQLGVDYKEIAKQSGAVSMATMTKEQQGKCLIILKEIEEGKK